MVNNNFDNCTSFHIDNGAFMGRLVRLDKVVNTILGRHQYPRQVSAVVAESTALGALLSSTIKYNGLFTLQTQSSGPVTMVVVDVTSEGRIRACANVNQEMLDKALELRKSDTDELLAAPHYMGNGHLAFTVDQGPETDLYQGIVDLQGKNLSECALRYFKQSEQIETYLQLFLQAPDCFMPTSWKLPKPKNIISAAAAAATSCLTHCTPWQTKILKTCAKITRLPPPVISAAKFTASTKESFSPIKSPRL